CSSYAGINVFF
nr:immunoglobulin light chain junction region [Macaca mulatta]MPO03054.1 immunoglobulin light chain junction region [Macaca mulatta]MPO03489.1 immunoglobulin light chain junction region [Macaca mulatta]MPO04054.1 immunoglobulin light chain junction region [Macaca mulatta]MPO06071.1 immunoglobulin light chain junction region [Macaca mulatta]